MGFLRPNLAFSFVGLRWENGDWGTLFRSSFGKVSDGSLKSIHLTPEETIIYNGLTQDDGTTTSWTLLEEFSLIHVGLSSVSQQAAKEINEDNVPLVEETARMKKARLAGLDTRGKATEPSFLKKHKEPIGEASTEGVGGHSAPITTAAPTAAAATGAFQPLWGFRRGDTVVGSTKHAWDCHPYALYLHLPQPDSYSCIGGAAKKKTPFDVVLQIPNSNYTSSTPRRSRHGVGRSLPTHRSYHLALNGGALHLWVSVPLDSLSSANS
ncbi:uncharacterized protein LOC141690592 [Apium graveolens]|uniref:uncharacterized protein LOC141690592 n=1 Tax=Apium graveolens TaxID=4045 RepID=UPI003D7A1F31